MNKLILLAVLIISAVILKADDQEKIFNRTTQYLDKGGIYFQFQNTQDLSRQFESLIQLGAKNSQAENLQLGIEFFRMFSKSLDLNSLQGFGVSVKDLNPNPQKVFPLYQNKSFISIDPKSSGSVFAAAKNTGGLFPSAANLPFNTIFAIGIKLNWSYAYENFTKSLDKENSAKSIIAMIEQNLGVTIPSLMQNISGDYFFAVYKGEKKDSFHFLAQLPDKNSVIKNIAQQKMAPLMKVYKDKSASFELPLPDGKFGSAYTVLFARNSIFIYDSDAPLNKLLNSRRREKLLVNVNPEIFGSLRNCAGNSFIALNLDTADILPDIIRKQYQATAIGSMNSDGYLQSGKSNFMIFTPTEYLPMLEIFNKMRANTEPSQQPSPLQ